MLRRIGRLGSTVFLLAASCASTHQPRTRTVGTAADLQSGATVGPAPKGKIIYCDMETRVGTHIPERVCRYEEDNDFIREETQEVIREGTQPKQGLKGG